MDRRRFLLTLLVGVLAAELAAEAQQAGKVWRIGLLEYASPDPARLAWWRAFQDRLRELGYVEGQDVVFQPRWANGQVSRLQGLATELVAALHAGRGAAASEGVSAGERRRVARGLGVEGLLAVAAAEVDRAAPPGVL